MLGVADEPSGGSEGEKGMEAGGPRAVKRLCLLLSIEESWVIHEHGGEDD